MKGLNIKVDTNSGMGKSETRKINEEILFSLFNQDPRFMYKMVHNRAPFFYM